MKWPLVRRERLDRVTQDYSNLITAHEKLQDDFDRVEFGYAQGVREGMSQAYLNVRDYFMAELGTAGTPQFLAWIHPRLDALVTKSRAIEAEYKSMSGRFGERLSVNAYNDLRREIPSLPERKL